MKKINIITGKIRVGKTTFLKNEIPKWKNVKGILQPVIDGERVFLDIESGKMIQISSKTENKKTFRIGKFIFNLNAFEWAKERLESILKNDFRYIIVDEYGPLEFSDRGLEPTVTKIIFAIRENKNQKLVIVIRESLVDKFIAKYNLLKDEIEIIRINSNPYFSTD
jgi:nucleoside-triphosphatase THEP1